MTNRGRRALAKIGPIHPDKVRHRDGDRCYMCGTKTRPVSKETRKDGTALVLEHVVPLVLGGEDTMYNLRVACMKCDSLKGGGAEMVDIMALLPALLDSSWLDYVRPKREPEPPKQKVPPALYRHVTPWTPPRKGEVEEEVDTYTMRVIEPEKPKRPKAPDLKVKPKVRGQDGWWNYEPRPAAPPGSTISATQITSREQLHEWWNRHEGEAVMTGKNPGVAAPTSFTSVPTEVVAMRWTGDNQNAIWDWISAQFFYGPLPVGDPIAPRGRPAELWVAANQEWLKLNVGCWIIQDQLGYYPCEDEIFQVKYRQTPRVGSGRSK